MSQGFFEQLKALKEVLSARIPAEVKLDRLRPLLEDSDVRREFWDELDDPDWIPVLKAEGFFTSPPPAEETPSGNRFPSWGPSKYLARVANLAPAVVVPIFARLRTNNVSIIGDLLDAAKLVPVSEATHLVPAVCKAAKDGLLWIHFKDASDLCVRLAEGGRLDDSLTLADGLFSPRPEPSGEGPGTRDDYWYAEGLRKVVPVLAGEHARAFLPRLCNWLRAAVGARKSPDPDTGDDYSYIWRPAVEKHEQNHDHDVVGVMAGCVRNGFELAIAGDQLSLQEAIKIIESYPYLIFSRIRLHLVGEFGDQNSALVEQTILNRELFDDYRRKHEYGTLVGRRLDLLSEDQRQGWYKWVDAGPPMSGFDDSVQQSLGRVATEDDRQARIRYWQFQKLHLVRPHLEGARRDFYEQMLTEHGEPTLADLNIHVGTGWRGAKSPMTVDDLTAKTFEQVVEEVSSWVPGGSGLAQPSAEGLAETFGAYISTNPELFSADAGELHDRPPIFVRTFVGQMNKAVKAGNQIALRSVLELCQWAIDRPVEENSESEEVNADLVDSSWQWTRDEISGLLESICKAKRGDAPRYSLEDLREPMWRLIEVLYRDRSASYIVRDVQKEDPRIHDYLDIGINAPRGKAVGTGLEYARWVANHLKISDGKVESVPGGFDAMPEVREMLLWQAANPSFEVMAVIGSQIGLIHWIDRKWLADHSAQLFDLESIERTPTDACGWAAWNAFLSWVAPHVEFYHVLRSQFVYAVAQASQIASTDESRVQPMHRLGEHLLVLYGRGQLDFDVEDHLLSRFISTANPQIRRHAIGFVGQSLGSADTVPKEIIERFMKLWDFYWAGPGRKDAGESPDSPLFGAWFSCGQFPNDWALDRMQEFVAVVPTPEPEYSIIERLTEMAHVDIVRTVRILDRIVRGDSDGWRLHASLDQTRVILEQAMDSDDARPTAEALIDYVGRRGYKVFGELLAK